MAKYKAFISYRKSHDTSADLVKKVLVEEYGFSHESIFLVKHNIGSEYFDTKLKIAVESSSCFVLIVTKDCFIPKEDGNDWFLEEIQEALDNEITIIPLLFDGIRGLKEKEVLDQLVAIARDAGLTRLSILCNYNSWELGKTNDLIKEFEKSKNIHKTVFFMEIDSLQQTFKQMELPHGIVGIRFSQPSNITDITNVVQWYEDWQHEEHKKMLSSIGIIKIFFMTLKLPII